MKLLFNNNIEIYNLYEEILEEIKKGIIDLYEECKMDSLESQPLDIAYKNLSKFFGRLTKLHDTLENIRLIMCCDTNLEPWCDLLQGDRLIRYVLVDGKEHPHEDEIEEAKRNLLPNLRTKKVQNMIKQGKVIRQKHNRYECREDGTIDVYRKEISDDELYQIRGEFLKGKKLAKIEKRKKQINKIFEGVE